MKKLFTFLLLGCAAVASAQQLPNSSFKEWKGEGNCGNSYQSSSSGTGNTPAGERKRPGDEPAGWNGSNVNQKVFMEASKPGYVSKGTGQDGTTCVKLTNLWVGALGIGDEAPAYITFGTPWVYAVTDLPSCDGGTYGGMKFAYRPDAIKGQYKRTPATTAENAHIIAYLWKGTFVSAIPSVGNVTKEDVDRAILGKTEAITSGTLIASCDYEFETTTNNDWQEIIVPLEYVEGQENTIPEKMNVIISSADYWTRGNIQANSILEVDNVEFVYYSQLQSLSYDGTAVENFDKNTYEYSIDAVYDASKLEAKADGVGATVEQSYYDKATGKLTITVKGNDWSKENLNQHVYTIQFKTYTGEISSISYNGTPIANFSQGTNHYYTVQGEYADGCLTATTEDEGLSAQITYDATTRIATISVPESGKEDINYYVKFAKEANQYTSKLVISMMNSFLTAPVQGVGITEEIDGKVDLQLQNFEFQGTNMGDIYVHDVAISADGILSKTDVIRIFGEAGNGLGDLSVTLNGNLTDGELSASLNILWNRAIPIVVTVYPQTTSSIDLTAINGIIESNITAVQEGLTNSNCIIYAADNVNAGEAKNVVTGTTCQSLELDAASNIEIPTGFTAISISLDRTFHAGWNTVCLPFNTTTDALGATQIQEFTAFEDESLKFEKVTNGTIEANKPYLIYFEEAPTTTTFKLSGEVMTTEPEAVTFGDVTFTGNYTAGMSMEGYYGVADQDGSQYIMKGGSNSTLGSTGAYFSVAGAAAEVNRLALDLDGVTAIGSVETEGAEDTFDVYSISGVKVRTGATNLDGLQRGLYIVNGKKVLVK